MAQDLRNLAVGFDQQAQELRFYDANGRFVRSAGGPGEGPGELSDQLLAVSVSPSDSIYVADYDMGRIDVYDPGGEPARTIRTPAHHLLNMVVSAEGDALGRVWHSSVDRRSGAFRIFDAIVAVGTAHGALDTVLEFDHTPPDFGTALENRWPVIANTAFWDRLVDGDIVWSSLEWNRVRVSTTGGRLARLVSFSVWHFRPVTEEEYAPLVAYSRQSDPRSPDPDAQLAPNAVMPTQLPAITAVRAAPDGGFWVQRMGPVTDAERPYPVINTAWLGGRLWDVFDTNGRYVRTVRVPDRFCLTRVTPSGAIGIQRGDMDVERVMRLVVGTP